MPRRAPYGGQTIAAGLLTPTLKTKRPAMEQRFANEIAALYGHRRDARSPAAGT